MCFNNDQAFQAPNSKQIINSNFLNIKPMIETQNLKQSDHIDIKKKYDLEERTFEFAVRVRNFVKVLPKIIQNIEYGKQLIRAASSVAANYIEANEALSKKDFVHRLKISRKEVKESRLWLRLCDIENIENLLIIQKKLIAESLELSKIFSAIISKCQ